MPRSRATIQFSIWRDKDFRSLPPAAQLAYFMLVSQRDVSQAGTMPLTPERWAKGCDGLTVRALEAALGELERARFVYIDDDTEELLIRSLIRNDGIADQPYILISAIREAKITESTLLRQVLACELRRVRKGIPTGAEKGRGKAREALDKVIPELENGVDCRTLPDPSGAYLETLPEPFPNPSRTLREPFANPSPESTPENPSGTLPEPFAKGSNPSRTLGGGGGGGGVVTSLESCGYGSSLLAERRSVPAPAEEATASGIVNEWVRASGSPLTPSSRTAMRLAVSQCLKAGHLAPTIAEGLADWAGSKITATSQIPAFVDRAAIRPRLAPTQQAHNADGWLALGEQLAAEEGR